MSVRLIIGRAGTGKTALCAREIHNLATHAPLGPPLLWIVPEQATFDAERLLLTTSPLVVQPLGSPPPTPAKTRGTFRAQVLSFRRLAMIIGKELALFPNAGGGGGRNVPKPMDDIARRVLLEEIVRREKNALQVFAGAANREGFITHLDAIMRELRQHGQTGATLRKMLDDVSAAGLDAVTRRKLMDLAHLLDAWTAEMNKSGEWDFEQIQRLAAQRMAQSRMIAGNRTDGARIWVDAFSAMTTLEIQMLTALGLHARELTITLLADPNAPGIRDMRADNEAGLFARTERLYRRLMDEFRRQGVRIEGTTALREAHRFLQNDLQRVEAELFGKPAPTPDKEMAKQKKEHLSLTLPPSPSPLLPLSPSPTPTVELWECSEPETEVRMVAQAIRTLALAGTRYRRIAVIVPDLAEAGEYQDALRRIFSEHDIPHFIDERRSMAHHPVVELVRSAVAAVTSNFGRDEMLLYLKTHLAGVAPPNVAELENYLWEHGITRTPWDHEWQWIQQNQREEDGPGQAADSARERLHRVNALRTKVWTDLAAFAAELSGAPHAAEAASFVRALRKLLATLATEKQLAAWIETARKNADAELAQVHEQAWRGIDELLTLLERVLTGRHRTLEEFERLLATALGELTLGLIPPTVDQVLVSSVTRSRVPEMDAVFLLGAVEGAFPKVVPEDPILSDAQREAFNARAADPIGEGADRQLLEMPFFDYVALTRARRRLVITHPVADRAGRALAPSRHLPRLIDLLGTSLVRHSFDAASRAQVHHMSTIEDVVTGVAAWGRALIDGQSEAKPDAMTGVYNWMIGSPDARMTAARDMAWRGLAPRIAPALSGEIAARFFPPARAIRMSVSQLEKYAACPSQYFYHYLLALSPRDELVLDSLGLGSLQHNILEGLYIRIIADEFPWPGENSTPLLAALEQEVDRAISELHAELAARTPAYDKTRRGILRMLGLMVETDRRRAAAGTLRPRAVELYFGKGHAPASHNGRLVSLPVLAIPTPAGRTLELTGKIDRLDADAAGKNAVLHDYKSGAEKRLDLHRIFHGLSVQLPVYALVARQLAGFEPVGAFLLSLVMKRETLPSSRDPKLQIAPDEDRFYQRLKPSGFASAAGTAPLDRQLSADKTGLAGDGKSAWFNAGFNKDRTIAKTSDLLSAENFEALLRHVQAAVARMADRLAAGDIAPAPFKDAAETPCPHCDFRPLCPFDASRDKYAVVWRAKKDDLLTAMKKSEV